MSLLRKIEKTFDQGLRGIFSAGDAEDREAIELYRDALERITALIQPGHEGRVFPFNRIRIELAAPTAERKAVLEAVFAGEQLLHDIRANFAGEKAQVPDDLSVAVVCLPEALADLNILCEREAPPAKDPDETARRGAPPARPARLRILHGEASLPLFELRGPRVNLGRTPEVITDTGRLLRRNDLHFPEDAHDVNPTVSREHAHLSVDPENGEWRLFDDGSSVGTLVFRVGTRIEVPARGARGVLLRPADEIYLGQVRLRFEA